MNDENKAVETLSKAMLMAMEHLLANAPFDRTERGQVKEKIETNKYIISIKGNEYTVKCNFDLSINEVVNVVFPQNKASNMFVLPNR